MKRGGGGGIIDSMVITSQRGLVKISVLVVLSEHNREGRWYHITPEHPTPIALYQLPTTHRLHYPLLTTH